MREKDKWANDFINSIKNMERRPGLTDIWLYGFNFAKEKMLDLCDAKNQIVGFTEINRLGEKTIKGEEK